MFAYRSSTLALSAEVDWPRAGGTSSAACTTPAMPTTASRAKGSRAGRPARRAHHRLGDEDLVESAGDSRPLPRHIGDDDTDRSVRFALENVARPLRGSPDLFLRTRLRQHTASPRGLRFRA